MPGATVQLRGPGREQRAKTDHTGQYTFNVARARQVPGARHGQGLRDRAEDRSRRSSGPRVFDVQLVDRHTRAGDQRGGPVARREHGARRQRRCDRDARAADRGALRRSRRTRAAIAGARRSGARTRRRADLHRRLHRRQPAAEIVDPRDPHQRQSLLAGVRPARLLARRDLHQAGQRRAARAGLRADRRRDFEFAQSAADAIHAAALPLAVLRPQPERAAAQEQSVVSPSTRSIGRSTRTPSFWPPRRKAPSTRRWPRRNRGSPLRPRLDYLAHSEEHAGGALSVREVRVSTIRARAISTCASRAYNERQSEQTVQITETAMLSPRGHQRDALSVSARGVAGHRRADRAGHQCGGRVHRRRRHGGQLGQHQQQLGADQRLHLHARQAHAEVGRARAPIAVDRSLGQQFRRHLHLLHAGGLSRADGPRSSAINSGTPHREGERRRMPACSSTTIGACGPT